MMYAAADNTKIVASPGASGTCPGCGEPLIPKCGSIRTWHWAHKRADCDSWYEPEGEWHREWKSKYPAELVEVAFGPHRADIATAKRVIELQHSGISPETVAAREAFYATVRPHGMVWLIDGTQMQSRFVFEPKDGYLKFHWKRCPAVWHLATRPLCIDMEGGIFLIKKMSPKGRGWGYAIDYPTFIAKFN
jgi:competence CoiA-like predicted nuclease